MAEQLKPDLCIIGAGSGGLSVAAAAAQLGVEVVLIERGKMGGDCLNYGCVPSKALLAAAKRAQAMRDAAPFGIKPVDPQIDYRAVLAHVHEVIAAIAPNDSVERFTGLGVKVIQADAIFGDRYTVLAGGYEIRARRFVIATGSSPAVPPIPGLDSVPFYTNETIFEAPSLPRHLVIIGGGPIGLEMAQAHRRLGSDVTVIEALTPLAKDDEEVRGLVLKRLAEEGVRILDKARLERAEAFGDGVRVQFAKGGQSYSLDGSHLLLAVGRRPNIETLNLAAAGIKSDRNGVVVNSKLKSSNRRVYAIGDVAGGPQFTHVANYHASLVIKNALFRLPARADHSTIPWVTFTDPELAHVGLTEAGAREKYGTRINVLRWPYHENDRAQAERQTEGFLKVITNRSGRILGASMVGAHAGELIQMWSLAMQKGINIKAMASFISPYPTLSEINKRAAITYFLPKLTNPLIKRVVGWLRKLG
ncbi:MULTISPECIES: FAD-dependent oxidoreductase [Rhodomicrobium]|uniref:dihydrolipoyl dehydrogenase family protein n=1 Tax=Rhodomicrobium TaxID=1068 RepID=UPI000B4B9D2C|nr:MULTISPECIES: FAD-dependent oxidoreductase [Rhodomicrobium]